MTLAAANALELLTRPGIPVLLPDGVYFETVRYPHLPGADDIVQWAKNAGDLAGLEQLRATGGTLLLFASWQATGDTGEVFKQGLLGDIADLGIDLGMNVLV